MIKMAVVHGHLARKIEDRLLKVPDHVGGEFALIDGRQIAEETANGGEPQVARANAIMAAVFEQAEKLPHEIGRNILEREVGAHLVQVSRCEKKQQLE